MSASLFRASRMGLAIVAAAAAGGCGSFNSMTQRFAVSLAPYKVEVVQGNFVSREQVSALRPGMSRLQVRDVLGTPLVTSVFHADRWDYVFTIKRAGVQSQVRRLAVFFKGDVLDRFEGDEMPTEAEFVATLDNKRQGAKVPALEATEEQLKKFAAAQPPAKGASAPVDAPASASYPPLEPASR
jgi:outer membrane protein assembly factor BamE